MAGHRHQSSLEGVINFSALDSLSAEVRSQATCRFYSIVEYCRAEELATGSRLTYSHALLIRCTYEYSRSEASKDRFLRAFFESMRMDIAIGKDPDFTSQGNQLRENLTAFAEFLLDNFFIPLKVPGRRTPQPSPAHLSVFERIQGAHEYIPTPERISALRRACLVRDHHRCVISRRFDRKEAVSRLERLGDDAKDDDGNQLLGEEFDVLEVAHIIPHSLTQSDANGELSDSKKAALAILSMLDCDVSHLIDGVNIDRPFNAMSLTPNYHDAFGSFKVESFLHPAVLSSLPVTRELYVIEDRSIDPPLPRLLALHRAIAQILKMSAAGEYIDKILRDMEDPGTSSGGSTELGRIVTLRMGGWLDGAVSVPVV
ncbi:hypothetical protein McanMca71_001230 [Microsporum canis]|uniref:HNH nuclease domain-containing protein n=1 Tax=Arthroderma otae (strain ATCC MYA-4605 / CBS 113480) TaxID=554155 RepID=C5FHF6_ARTOC|nr:conserved hypothetical protein [Microsporum canis CBS 113480]EEQ28696.1 conserved hypothetical protein [Microsporum canis CBS 113480]